MPDSRKPTAADHAWAEEQARQIEAAMTEAAEGGLSTEALRELRDWLINGAPTCGNLTYVAGAVSVTDVRKLFRHIDFLRAALSRAEAGEEHAKRLAAEAIADALRLKEAASRAEAERDEAVHLLKGAQALARDAQGWPLTPNMHQLVAGWQERAAAFEARISSAPDKENANG